MDTVSSNQIAKFSIKFYVLIRSYRTIRILHIRNSKDTICFLLLLYLIFAFHFLKTWANEVILFFSHQQFNILLFIHYPGKLQFPFHNFRGILKVPLICWESKTLKLSLVPQKSHPSRISSGVLLHLTQSVTPKSQRAWGCALPFGVSFGWILLSDNQQHQICYKCPLRLAGGHPHLSEGYRGAG